MMTDQSNFFYPFLKIKIVQNNFLKNKYFCHFKTGQWQCFKNIQKFFLILWKEKKQQQKKKKKKNVSIFKYWTKLNVLMSQKPQTKIHLRREKMTLKIKSLKSYFTC